MRNNRLLFHFLKKYFPNFFKKPSTLFVFLTQCLTASRPTPESAKLPNSKVSLDWLSPRLDLLCSPTQILFLKCAKKSKKVPIFTKNVPKKRKKSQKIRTFHHFSCANKGEI
jgi:hypothetical protein